MRTKQLDCRFKTNDETDDLREGEFIAYPSTFTRHPDCYGDVVAPGAFLDSITRWKESGNTMPVLYGHRMDDPDYNVGGVTDMGEDDHGWWIRGSFDMDSPKAAQTYRLVKAKRISQLSFAFDVDDEGTVTLDDGTKANELRKLTVYEASFVPIGANQDTSVVAIKGIGASAKAGRVLSAANVDMLTGISEQLAAASKQMKDFLASATAGQEQENNQSDGAKASEPDKAKNEEPQGAKSEEPNRKAEAEALDLAIRIALKGQKGEQACPLSSKSEPR